MGRSLFLVGFAAIAIAMPSSAHAECLPAAVTSGDPALAKTLSERLAANGIATSATSGCPAVRVRVERRGEHLHLEVTDEFARLGEREVRDVATAAAIVESWTLQEIEAGSLPELSPPPPIAPPSPPPRWGLAASFEPAIADDGATWLGVAITGCARIGPLCVGGLARGARDTRTSGDTAGSNHRSHELHALATIDLPRRLGRLTLSPGVGLGYGWLAITASHLDMHMMPIEITHSAHALRADAHVTIARPLGRRLSLYAELRADTAISRTAIPAGPQSFARAAIGARFEVP